MRITNQKVAVVGSGFGGLAAAIRLQAAGFQVTLFEKRDRPGGRAYVYEQDGFTFDAGPTVVTAPECLEELFQVSGRTLSQYVSLEPVFPLYRLFWDDGEVFDYSNDLGATLDQIRKKSPSDVDGYRRFLKYTEKVFEEGYEKLAHVPFLDWKSMIRVAPQLIQLGAYRSVYQTVSRFIQDPHLREAFSFHSLLVGGNPFQASSIYTLIHFLERKWGVFFPKGGTGALVNSLVKLFQDIGGQVFLSAELEQIMVEDQEVTGVTLKNGEKMDFDFVVSNADIVHTYQKLLQDVPVAQKMSRRLEKMHHSMSLFLIYFGTRKTYPELAHHNILFGPRYRGLLEDIFTKGCLPDDFSLYLHAPTRTDPSLAPPGHECFYVLSPVSHLGKLDIDWKRESRRYSNLILEYLERRLLPGLRENLVTQKIFTPQDFKNELNSHLGSAFSVEPRLTQSAYFRPHNKDEQIRGLYFVGAGTHPGAGLPGVISSAKATVGLILQDSLQEEVVLYRKQSSLRGSARARL